MSTNKNPATYPYPFPNNPHYPDPLDFSCPGRFCALDRSTSQANARVQDSSVYQILNIYPLYQQCDYPYYASYPLPTNLLKNNEMNE